MSNVKNHDVLSVGIEAKPDKVFEYIANPFNLPNWTTAFKEADENSALLVTPNGELRIGLEVKANRVLGTIDWIMKMPDGSIGVAYSRVVTGPNGKAIYSFVLTAPPVHLEQIEGALAAQTAQLKEELQNLQIILSE